MKKVINAFLLVLTFFYILSIGISANPFPENKLKKINIVELKPTKLYQFKEFKIFDLKYQNQFLGSRWSTIHPRINLSKFVIKTLASSELSKKYSSSNLFDNKLDTAWVEGANEGGIGEWVKIKIEAEKDSPTTTPFSITKIGIIPGYAKSTDSWENNNRVKTLLVIIHSPPPLSIPKNEWVVYRLILKDVNMLQVFDLPEETRVSNEPMIKNVWIRIESIYKGKKYDDTCISEMVLVGGCSS